MKRQLKHGTSVVFGFVITVLLLAGIFLPTTHATFSVAESSSYSTFFGGSMGEDATKVTFDNEGNTILIGQTPSEDLPITDNAFQSEYAGGGWDGYVAKFSPSGDLLYSSYLGGDQYEHVTTVRVDAQNNIILAGTTGSTDFPVTPDAYQSTKSDSLDGFIMKVAENGTLIYSTYFGGTGEDWIYGMEFDASGNYMFAGSTGSSGLATSGVIGTSIAGGVIDGFIAKLSAEGSTKLMFSYIGGNGVDRIPLMKIDSNFNYVIVGFIQSTDFPVTGNAFQSVASAQGDAILAKVSGDGTDLMYSTYIGGNDDDTGLSVALDSQDNMIISGYTESDDLAVVNAIQPTFGGGAADIYIAKFNNTGSIQFLTYLGGNETDYAWEVITDPDDNIIVGGRTSSINYPVHDGLNDTHSGSFDGVVTKLSPDGQTNIVSSFVGGSDSDIGEGLAVDDAGNVVLTGRTVSSDFPLTAGAYQTEIAGSSDAFVCHIAFGLPTTTPSNTTTTDGTPIDTTSLLLIGAGGVAVVIVLVILFKRK